MGKRASGDYYAVLGVGSRASADEIEHAFRERAKRLHPDLNPSANAAEQFAAVVEAHDVLSDAGRRREYDRARATVTTPATTRPANARSRPMRMQKRRRHSQWRYLMIAVVVLGILGAQIQAGRDRDANHVPPGYERATATRVGTPGAMLLSFVTQSGQSVRIPDPSAPNIDPVGSRVEVQYPLGEPSEARPVPRSAALGHWWEQVAGLIVFLPIAYVARRLWFGRVGASPLHNHWYADLDDA